MLEIFWRFLRSLLWKKKFNGKTCWAEEYGRGDEDSAVIRKAEEMYRNV